MISLIWLKGDSLDWSELLLLKLFDLGSEDDLWGLDGVDAGSLDGNDEGASVLHEHGCVKPENTRLIGLSHISEDNVHHGHKHAVLLGVSGILDDGDHVGALLGHVHEVAA